jgi:hypothetical protein
MERKPSEGVQLCGARNRQGVPCRNYCANGRTRCRFHGGASTGPRTSEGLVKAAANLRTHGFYSRLLPATPDAALYDEASGEASLAAELKLLRAKLGTLVLAGAGDRTIMEVVDAIRRLASIEKAPTQTSTPVVGAAFQVNFVTEGTRPEEEEPIGVARRERNPT